MKKVKELIFIVIGCILFISFLILLANLNKEIEKQYIRIENNIDVLAQSYCLEISNLRTYGSNIDFTIEKTDWTEEVIRFFNDNGYTIQYEEIVNDPQKGYTTLMQFKKDFYKDEEIYLPFAVKLTMQNQGYKWGIN